MRENVGHADRIARTIIGPTLLLRGLGQLVTGKWRGVLNIIAGSLVVESALTRVCPFNAALGIDTRSTQERMTDFRADVTEQTERITADYSRPIGFDEAPVTAQ